MVKFFRVDGGSSQPVKKQQAAGKAKKSQGAKSTTKNQGAKKDVPVGNDATKAGAIINLYKSGKIGHLVLEDALSTMGYSKEEIARIMKEVENENPKDLYDQYFVNPHFSDEEDF